MPSSDRFLVRARSPPIGAHRADYRDHGRGREIHLTPRRLGSREDMLIISEPRDGVRTLSHTASGSPTV
jgi:hypothetical protein